MPYEARGKTHSTLNPSAESRRSKATRLCSSSYGEVRPTHSSPAEAASSA